MPQSRSFCTKSALLESRKYVKMLFARISPMPSTAPSSASDAFLRFSSVLNRLTKSFAVFLPMPSMPNANKNLSSVVCLDFSIAPSKLSIFLSPNPSSPNKSIAVIFIKSTAFSTCVSLYKSSAVFSLNPSISIASLDAKWSSFDMICGAQLSPVQYKNAPTSLTGAWQTGHSVGFSMAFASGFSIATPIISGITSLERRTNTLSPILTFFFRISP